jgi:hypothetical protein
MLDSESSFPGRPWTFHALSHGLDGVHFIPEIPSRLDFIPEHHVCRLRLVDALPRLGKAQAEPEVSAESSHNDMLPQVPACCKYCLPKCACTAPNTRCVDEC